jgi:predicted transcriptional regulator
VVKEMADEGMTQHQIGDVLGVHQRTVWNDLHVDEKASDANGEEVDFDENASRPKKNSVKDFLILIRISDIYPSHSDP